MRESNHSTQPEYWKIAEKALAREAIVNAYRSILGVERIDRQWWSLCNRQPDVPTSEINQLVNVGFLTKPQYYGVDRDCAWKRVPTTLGKKKSRKVKFFTDNIEQNEKDHPDAHWFNGDLLEIISKNWSIFMPSIVYYDSTHTSISASGINTLSNLMTMCLQCAAPNVMIAANLMNETGWDKKRYDPNSILGKLSQDPTHWWLNPHGYKYTSSKVEMTTIFFVKK